MIELPDEFHAFGGDTFAGSTIFVLLPVLSRSFKFCNVVEAMLCNASSVRYAWCPLNEMCVLISDKSNDTRTK
jgi:hypothetical protein